MKISENTVKWSCILIFGVLVFWVSFRHLFTSKEEIKENIKWEEMDKWDKFVDFAIKETLKRCSGYDYYERKECEIEVCRTLYTGAVVVAKEVGITLSYNDWMDACIGK